MGLTGYRMGKNCPSITKQKISNIENNLTEASIDMVSNFCEIYSNVNANYILTGKGPMFIEDEDSGSSQQDTDSMSLSYDELSRCMKQPFQDTRGFLANWKNSLTSLNRLLRKQETSLNKRF